MSTPTDPAVVYPGVAAFGSLAAALRAEVGGRLGVAAVRSSDSAPLLHATVASRLPYREPLRISAWQYERRWSIRGTEPSVGATLIDGTTDDLAEVAKAAWAWHDGEPLRGIRQAAPFVHLTGRFEVPDHDPARLAESLTRRLDHRFPESLSRGRPTKRTNEGPRSRAPPPAKGIRPRPDGPAWLARYRRGGPRLFLISDRLGTGVRGT
ncbi:hypothetical protein [Streptomyces sp. NRRL B-3648]|uniref:hypothetical protein n=1 Tax=Streptomyces sp. NRRL B-3648 TaxID=1519493 RepID=UPI00131BD179|nr:hypothetical protein [Streptomyces sp. NRRL B-3648]